MASVFHPEVGNRVGNLRQRWKTWLEALDAESGTLSLINVVSSKVCMLYINVNAISMPK